MHHNLQPENNFLLDEDIIHVLMLTDKLFEAVKNNNYSEVQSCIKVGACVNARNTNYVTSLHYAVSKGHEDIVNILLQNNSNPNIIDEKGFTSLHYAAKFSHVQISKTLLICGATYNAVSKSGKTPIDMATNKNIKCLLEIIDKSFMKIKIGNCRLINDLKNIRDTDTVKAIIGTTNAENKTLITLAIHNDFPKVEQLKEILQDDLADHFAKATMLCNQEEYQKALTTYKYILSKRKEILGENNPGTLDIQRSMAEILYKQQKYEALNMLEEIYQKQKKMLGDDKKDTLNTRSSMALILHRQGKNDEALSMYRDVYRQQNEILSENDQDFLSTQLHMALVLNDLHKYKEALDLNYKIYKNRKQKLGICHPATLVAENNIAMVLSNQEKFDEALEAYKRVYEARKKVLGLTHSDTLRTLHNMAAVLNTQGKSNEALELYQDILRSQKKVLGFDHIDTLNTQENIGRLLFSQGKYMSALKMFNECLAKKKVILGSNHPGLLITQAMIYSINEELKYEGAPDLIDLVKNHDIDIKNAISCGDIKTVQYLLKDHVDVDVRDSDGRTLLHFATDNGNTDIVNMLIEIGAVVTQVTNKGNTPLHIACSKGYEEIVKVLIKHVSREQLNDFINRKTTNSGTTSLHVAAKNGYFRIVKLLLQQGAIYNLKNKEDKTPFDMSKDQDVIFLLDLVNKSFKDVKIGSTDIVNKLSAVKPDDLVSIMNARDNQGNSLIQVAILDQRKDLAKQLLVLLKKS